MNHEKVLIVEDEENERSGLAELVTSWGYRVETARDGAEGLEKATQWSPSIVVTDLKMPRMGGMELLEKVAAASQTVAVIVVTAQGTIDSAVQAMRMGAFSVAPPEKCRKSSASSKWSRPAPPQFSSRERAEPARNWWRGQFTISVRVKIARS